MILAVLSLLATLTEQPAAVKLEAAKNVVPLKLFHGKATVDVLINGKGPFSFFLDTGAGGTVLNRDLADELGLSTNGKTRIGDPADPQAIEADRVDIESVAIGGVTFSRFSAVTWDRKTLYGDTPGAPRGVLGIPLFAHLLLTLDYPQGEVRLERGKLETGPHVVPYRPGVGGISRLEVNAGSMTVEAALDTGSPSGLSLPKKIADRLKLSTPLAEVGRGRTVNSDFAIYAATLDGNLSVAGFDLPHPRLTFNETLPEAHFGYEVLKAFRITIDQANELLRFERSETPASASTENRFGNRVISFENGEVFLQRDGGPKLKLVPVEFEVSGFPEGRVRFVRDASGAITAIEVLNRDGVWERAARGR